MKIVRDIKKRDYKKVIKLKKDDQVKSAKKNVLDLTKGKKVKSKKKVCDIAEKKSKDEFVTVRQSLYCLKKV